MTASNPHPTRQPNRKSVENRDATRKDSLALGSESKPPKPVDVKVSTAEQPVETQPADTATVEASKEPAKEEEIASAAKGEIIPVAAALVKLPEIAVPDQPIALTPLLDPQLFLSGADVLKPLLGLIEDDVPPSPPAAQSTRPRRVLNPKSQKPDSDQSPQAEPTRLQRPPVSAEPVRLRRPPAQSKPPSDQ